LLPGPQADAEALEALTTASLNVAKADRMGLRLSGGIPGGEVISEAVPIGAVQVPPGGTPLLLLADRGTVGGYAKPAIVHPDDLWKAGQLREGSEVEFVPATDSRVLCLYEL
jgi:allophanate hydrolase subunit 2